MSTEVPDKITGERGTQGTLTGNNYAGRHDSSQKPDVPPSIVSLDASLPVPLICRRPGRETEEYRFGPCVSTGARPGLDTVNKGVLGRSFGH